MTYLNPNTTPFTNTANDNTPEGGIIRAGGQIRTKTITLTANATSDNVNVFQLTGTINIISLQGQVIAATTLTNCTNVYFDLWDGTVSSKINKTPGSVLSGYGVGSYFINDGSSSAVLTTINNDQARLTEAFSGAKVFIEFLVTQKLSTNTYIRFNYTTTDAPINAQIEIQIVYNSVDGGSLAIV